MPIKPLIEQAPATLAEKLAERTDLTVAEAFDLPHDEMLDQLIESMPISELKLDPNVTSNESVRLNLRADVESALRGEMVEKEREAAARDAAAAENERAPTEDQIGQLNSPPTIEPTLSADGSFVESLRVSRWELNEDGIPHQVHEEVTPSES